MKLYKKLHKKTKHKNIKTKIYFILTYYRQRKTSIINFIFHLTN